VWGEVRCRTSPAMHRQDVRDLIAARNSTFLADVDYN
jgi:hypothetical protein